MQATPSITAIKELIDQIEREITTVVPAEGQYGVEQEYTHQELLKELASMLTDLKTLTENPKQFLSLSTYDERQNIQSDLQNSMGHLSNPDRLWTYIDSIKKNIRPFNIRYTKARFLTTQNELEELEKAKTNLQQTLFAMRRDRESTEENKFIIDKILQSLQQQEEALQQQAQTIASKLANTESQVQESQNYASAIEQYKNKVGGYKPVVDTFVKKIADREGQLENQKVNTEKYNSQLDDFKNEHAKLLKEAEDLIQMAHTALGYGQAKGISAAFKTRLDRLENVAFWKSANTYWLGVAIVFSGIAIWLGYDFIQAIKDITDIGGENGISLNFIFARFLVISLPVAVIWFCTGQYIKNKNLTEDYAYKTILAQSIIGFSEQLKNDDQSDSSYLDYVKKMLDEIHQHPLKNHKKHSTSYSSPAGFWGRSKEDKPEEQ